MQSAPARDTWLAFWSSRLAVAVAGAYAILAVGYRPTGGAPHTGAPLGDLGELLLGQADRWDAAYYLQIASHGYGAAKTAAFFPLYPLTVAGLGAILSSTLVAGILVSLVAFAAGLYLLHRLVALELGDRHARTAVLVMAFFPTALFFSAIYAEALLLALTVGAVYAARTGHWAWAGILGALAAATHNSGVLVAIPVALLYWYGPRGDSEDSGDRGAGSLECSPARSSPATVARPATRSAAPPGERLPRRLARSLRPRYGLRPNALWVVLVPLGLVAFLAYMGFAYGDALRPLHVNSTLWHRQFVLLGGLTHLPHTLWQDVRTIAKVNPAKLFPATNGPYRGAASNLVDFAALVLAVTATVGVVRRLPVAYSAYTIVALVVFVSAPKRLEPLLSLPRFVLILFPLQMAIAVWLDEHPARRGAWLACSGVALGAFAMQFATGRWVA
jgi:hypothetical protein